jgi:hypothetical protein
VFVRPSSSTVNQTAGPIRMKLGMEYVHSNMYSYYAIRLSVDLCRSQHTSKCAFLCAWKVVLAYDLLRKRGLKVTLCRFSRCTQTKLASCLPIWGSYLLVFPILCSRSDRIWMNSSRAVREFITLFDSIRFLTGRWIMFRIVIAILIYHRHKPIVLEQLANFKFLVKQCNSTFDIPHRTDGLWSSCRARQTMKECCPIDNFLPLTSFSISSA